MIKWIVQIMMFAFFFTYVRDIIQSIIIREEHVFDHQTYLFPHFVTITADFKTCIV
ncbi:hypothetical protein BDB00DRAFT_798669 [Zychaea mexicana]|uniref:uncharacterized protein n=1 Tax=Zychaea mexicana TaxID=64656 RepID=UPI0022FE9FAD|nr:uncharacterized protein BDB00DRAFT_798669 [Zychaea mexicana]KAI9498610.1 hypothetical protein BDB00DRAFT_798669 [Zychaea mexicana]